MPSAAHSRASARVYPSTAARAAEEWVMPVRPWCGESVMLMIVPPSGRAHRELGGDSGHPLGPADVEAGHRPPALGLDRLGRDEVLAARVVDEHVEPAVPLQALAHDPLGVLVAADVAGHRARERADPLAGVRQHVLPAAGEDDVRSAGGELGRGGAAEVGAAAGDEDHLSFEEPGSEDGRRYGR